VAKSERWVHQKNKSDHLRLLSEDFLSPPWLVEVEWGAMELECGAMALECGAMSGNVSRIASAKLPRPFEGRVLQHNLYVYLFYLLLFNFLLCVFLGFEFYGTGYSRDFF
jgi:hypothetical protein